MFSGNKLHQNWVTSSFVYLFLVAILGVIMRCNFFTSLPLPFSHILHSHSHTALLGWSFVLAISGIINYYNLEINKFRFEFISFTIAILGMFISFLYQGYGAVSISFSTLFIITSYIIFYKIFKGLKNFSVENNLLKWGMIWFIISTIGIWCIPPVSIFLGKDHDFYKLCIQFFLHFQINGWLLYSALGLLIDKFKVKHSRYLIFGLNASLILTFALNIYWVDNKQIFYLLNALGIILQLIVYYKIAYYLFFKPLKINKNFKLFYYFILLILILKPTIQFVTINSTWALTLANNRFLIIAFLHFILIGIVSFSFIIYSLQKNILRQNFLSLLGILLWSVGFMITEIILLLQGFGIFSVTYFFLLLFFSIIMLIGISIILYERLKNLYYKRKILM